MGEYRLTHAANEDLDRLCIYGAITFGVDQADRYAESIIDRFADIASHPERWREVPEVQPGYRRSVFGSHSIYYRLDPDEVVIVRILGRENVDDAFIDAAN